MTMTPRLRTFALTMHVTSSVGWLGAVAAFLALSIAGLTSGNDETMRAAYLAMQLVTWTVIVPLSGASLITGVIQSLGSSWGLFRHYWVVAKLGIGVVASILLLLHTRPIQTVAAAAAERPLFASDLRQLRIQLFADALAALAALVVATTLSVYKPQGMTRHGRRTLQDRPFPLPSLTSHGGTSRWVYLPWVVGIVLLLIVVLRHLGGGMGGH
jgi:hypothetical protein